MPLFGLSDIKFSSPAAGNGAKGPLAALTSNEFKTTTLRYPIDLGSYDKGHYVVFYIKQQKKTAAKFQRGDLSESLINVVDVGGQSGSTASSAKGLSLPGVPSLSSIASNVGSQLLGKVNSGLSQLNSATGGALSGLTSKLSSAAAGAVGAVSGAIGSVENLFGKASSLSGSGAATTAIIDKSIKKISDESFLKTTQLTKDAIALYMPDTLTYNYQQSYDQLSVGNELAGQVLAAGSSALDKFKDEGSIEGLKSLMKSAGTSGGRAAIGAVSKALGSEQTGQLAAAALLGSVTNPMLEMVYKSPSFRSFQYDFMFYPRDENEALEVQRIIERFRFHQAPEFLEGAKGSLVPPSEFEIRFYYAGAQNPNLPQVGRCVLTSIDTNYAPNGWSSYEVPGENKPSLGRTGMPTAIQMTLQFQEVVYLTKQDFREDLAFSGTLSK